MAAVCARPVFAQPASQMDAGARERFERGAALAAQGNHEEASREFEASYALDPEKESLFAWAQSERLRGNCVKAVELYRAFMDSPGLTASQTEIAGMHLRRCERVVEEVKATAPEPAPAPAPMPAPAVVATAPPRGRSALLGGLLIGGTVAALGTAATLYALSVSQVRGAPDEPTLEAYEDRWRSGRAQQRVAAAFAAGGVLLGGAALAWALFPVDARLHAYAVPGTAGLLWRGTF